MVIERLTHRFQACAQFTEVDHHAGDGVPRADQRGACMVGMTMDAPAAGRLDLPLQRMGGVEKKQVHAAARHTCDKIRFCRPV